MPSDSENGNNPGGNIPTPNPPQDKSASVCLNIIKSELFWFLAFSILISIATVYQMNRANNIFKESHQRIIDQNKTCEELTKSFLQICGGIESDTTITKEDRIILIENLNNLNEKIIRQDFDQKITNLLEIESTKIQNEFEILNLWCALLTVVFLIFSFFSIFKTNEMSRQGEEALKNLRDTAKEAKGKSDSIEDKVSEAEKRIKAKEEELTQNLKAQIECLEKNVNVNTERLTSVEGNLTNAFEKLEEIYDKQTLILTQTDEKISEAESNLSQIIKIAVVKEATSFISEKNTLIDSISSEVKVINNQLINLHLQVERLVTANRSDDIPSEEELEDVDDQEDDSNDDEP